jgi:hypothetical protein
MELEPTPLLVENACQNMDVFYLNLKRLFNLQNFKQNHQSTTKHMKGIFDAHERDFLRYKLEASHRQWPLQLSMQMGFKV